MSERETLGSAQALALGGELSANGQRGAHSRSVTDGRKVASEVRYKASDAGDRQYTKSKFTGTSSVRAIALRRLMEGREAATTLAATPTSER